MNIVTLLITFYNTTLSYDLLSTSIMPEVQGVLRHRGLN